MYYRKVGDEAAREELDTRELLYECSVGKRPEVQSVSVTMILKETREVTQRRALL